MKQITLEERRVVQLEMLDEFDMFCRNNNLKYSLAYGTLLGAVRHKGFIPWDDDVDLIMPLNDLEKLKSIFKSDTIKFCDVDTESYYEYPFPRLSYKSTFRKMGKINITYGVNIDLYALVPFSADMDEGDKFLKTANRLLNIRLLFMKTRRYLIRHLPLNNIPFFRSTVKMYRDYLFYHFKSNNNTYHYAVSGLPTRKEVYDFNIFDNIIDIEFEGHTYMATGHYHRWLTQEYGDYMVPPPVAERRPYHGGRYFWK